MPDALTPLPVGTTVGHLTVSGQRQQIHLYGQRLWTQLCTCSCGSQRLVPVSSLATARIKSCGCRRGQRSHGATAKNAPHWPIYLAWRNMEQRCYNSNHTYWANYGARGIKVGGAWHRNFPAFLAWALKNGWARNTSLARIDNNGPYTPENCSWAVRKPDFPRERNVSSKKVGVMLGAWGENKSVYEWARDPRCKVTAPAIAYRIKQGWPADKAISLPAHAPKSGGI